MFRKAVVKLSQYSLTFSNNWLDWRAQMFGNELWNNVRKIFTSLLHLVIKTSSGELFIKHFFVSNHTCSNLYSHRYENCKGFIWNSCFSSTWDLLKKKACIRHQIDLRDWRLPWDFVLTEWKEQPSKSTMLVSHLSLEEGGLVNPSFFFSVTRF